RPQEKGVHVTGSVVLDDEAVEPEIVRAGTGSGRPAWDRRSLQTTRQEAVDEVDAPSGAVPLAQPREPGAVEARVPGKGIDLDQLADPNGSVGQQKWLVRVLPEAVRDRNQDGHLGSRDADPGEGTALAGGDQLLVTDG